MHVAVTILRPGELPRTSNVVTEAILPVDFVQLPTEDRFLIVAAGEHDGFTVPVPAEPVATLTAPVLCEVTRASLGVRLPTAVGLDAAGGVVVQSRSTRTLRRADALTRRRCPNPPRLVPLAGGRAIL